MSTTLNGYTTTVFESDTFHHANQDPYISASWATPVFTGAYPFAILNNEAVVSTQALTNKAFGWQSVVGSNSWSANQYAQLQIDHFTEDQNSTIGFYFRSSADSETAYSISVINNPNSDLGPGPGLYFSAVWYTVAQPVLENIGGLLGPNGNGFLGPYTYVPGAVFASGFFGSNFFVMYNGIVLWQAVDTNIPEAGLVEMFLFANAVQTDVQVSNFQAGSLSLSSVYSVPDCRDFATFPNSFRTVQATKIYDVQTSSNSAVPSVDSRVAGAPVDSKVSAPQNSRVDPSTVSPD